MTPALRILFVTLIDCGGSDRIVAAMGRLGAECAVLAAPSWFAARSQFVTKIFPISASAPPWWHSLRLRRRLERARGAWRPDVVIPLDDFAARSLRDPTFLRRASPDLRRLITRSFGAPASYDTACSRHGLTELAQTLGLHTPREYAVHDLASAQKAAEQLGFPLVLKREATSGGCGVTIVEDAAQLASVFGGALRKAGLRQGLARVPGFATAHGSELILQSHVPGPVAFTTAACVDGVLADAVSLVTERSHPAVTGASTVVRPIERPDLTEAARAVIAALGCSGIVSFDFILAPDGRAVLIEMNARPTASGHLGRLFGHDIYGALVAALGGMPTSAAVEAGEPPEAVALFPREFDRDPDSHVFDDRRVLHDVAWDDSTVLPIYAAWLTERHPDQARRIETWLQTGTGRPSATLSDLIEVPGSLLQSLAGPGFPASSPG